MNRVILAIEIILFCTPAAALLYLGVLFLPASLLFLSAPTSCSGDLPLMPIMIISGVWGSISLTNLAWNTFSRTRKWPGRPIQWFGIALGIISCIIGLSTFSTSEGMALIFVGPIITTAHLLYLSRNQNVSS